MKVKSPFAPSNLLAAVQTSLKDDQQLVRARLAATKSARIKGAVKLLSHVLRRAQVAHEGPYTVGHTAYVSTYHQMLDATLYIDVSQLKGNSKLEAFLSWMLEFFETKPTMDCVTEYTTSRTFNFVSRSTDEHRLGEEEWHPSLRVEVVCRVSGDSSTCRKVVVGTKLVEQNVYALECA